MKTMTCEQMGGPCDHPMQGETANDVIKMQDQHLKDMVASSDEAHRPALEAMQGRWKKPVSGLKWYSKTKKDFAALPED